MDLSRKTIHLFINGLAASAGGGLTYIRNVLPRLANRHHHHDLRVTVLLSRTLSDEFIGLSGITVLSSDSRASTALRFCYEQYEVPRMIRRAGADVLLSPGNFAIFRSPVPQILLSGNALYVSTDFVRDLRQRGEYGMWLDNAVKARLARWSIAAAESTIAPTAAFANELRTWTGKEVIGLHHGFDRESFFRNHAPLPQPIQKKLAATEGSLRLLLVSHYNYYRNFETLIRAVAILKKKLHPRPIRLILTCTLNSNHNPGSYRAESALAMVRDLQISDEVIQLGAIPYNSVHQVYQACDFYVTAAYAETFAHPLVEAMAGGLPVIASDLSVHREICGQAALYFPRFSPEDLAETVFQAIQSPERSAAMRAAGLSRSRDFSWDQHLQELLSLAHSLAKNESLPR
ncbi:MAG: glycosyltransferase family 1 protein [Candidatus Sulfotelmatobacter sp.]